ncbi:MAG TPA: DUF523 domain-containing protein [Syntrophomonadaceae bacterium]|nr:DUF523 domain-containing protein [Syntrophomonadaceae bacterium]
MILISACLCGKNCKYNGGNNTHPHFVAMYNNKEVLPVCPEELGGLSTPRKPCEIRGGTGLDVLKNLARVVNTENINESSKFIKGAQETLKIARDNQIDLAILQDRSPSCGVGVIYDGTFSKNLTRGDGVTAAALRQSGVNVITAADYLHNKGV